MSKNTITTKLPTALAPFTGVDNATARLLKAISVTELNTLREGDTVYVQSFRDYWKWLPTSVIASDDTTYCAPTVVGAGAGRFERLLGNPSPDWLLQTAWTVDSTAANEEGTNTVKTDIEISRRWGLGIRAQLSIAASITYMQTPAQQTNLLFQLTNTGSLTIIGTPTITKAGTVLTAITTQNRATPVRWAIAAGAILDATDIGKIYVITASGTPANVNAYALAMKDNGGNVITVSPFGTYNNATGAFTTITPGVGDTIEVRDMRATMLIGNIEGYGLFSGTQLGVAKVLFDSIHLASAVGANQASSVRACGLGFAYARTTFASIVFSGPAFNNASEHFLRGGGGVPGCVMSLRGGASATLSQIGMIDGFFTVNRGSKATTTSDCYFQNTRVQPLVGGPFTSNGCAWFDRATANSSILIESGAIFTQLGAVPDWGTNNTGFGVFVQSCGNYAYATKPTVNGGLGVGRESSIGGTDKLYAAVPYIEGANNAALVLIA